MCDSVALGSPAFLCNEIERSSSGGHARVTIPEGWTLFDIARRKDLSGIDADLLFKLRAVFALLVVILYGNKDLVDVVKELNRLMTESTAPERFITAAFALFDAPHRIIESVVCGHPNPAIAGHSIQIMESTGIPLGIIATFPYESRRYEIPKGAIVFFYTDGLSEARYHGALIGAKGIEEWLKRPEFRSGGLKEALERLVDSPNMMIEDDITVLAIRLSNG